MEASRWDPFPSEDFPPHAPALIQKVLKHFDNLDMNTLLKFLVKKIFNIFQHSLKNGKVQ